MTEHARLPLYKALAAAIAAMADPKKNQSNPAFKRDGKAIGYADLGSVLECIEAPLREHGLLLIQTVDAQDAMGNGCSAVLTTKLIHVDTDHWLTSTYPLKPGKDDPQGFAGAVTYARRQSIKTMFGMVEIDDDGNTATNGKQESKRTPPATTGPLPLEQAKTAMARATTLDDLKAVFETFSYLKGEDLAALVAAKDARKAELTKTSKT